MDAIKELTAREVLDSRGNPTVEVEVRLADGTVASATVPSGASTGQHEALELRDRDAKRFGGEGVRLAVAHVTERILPELSGISAHNQREIDERMLALDGTPDKSALGANAMLAVSMALARAAAAQAGLPLFRYLGGAEAHLLPVPQFNIINGGMHADNRLDIQEFMVIPAGLPSFADALRAGAEIYHALKDILKHHRLSTCVGDEGGFALDLTSSREALGLMVQAIEAAGYAPGEQVWLGCDVAASSFLSDGSYRLAGEDLTLDTEGLTDYYAELMAEFPLVSIEDPFAEEDWEGFAAFTKAFGGRVQVVGDDLYVTNRQRIAQGIDRRATNAVLIKLNQIGTVTETLGAVEMTRQQGWNAVVSHRSGETEDTFIAHLAVATGAGQIKAGAPCRGERVAKYNELLRIEESLGESARFAGREVFARFLG